MWRTVLALFVLVYVVVALLNYSLVQSMAGSVASDYFTKEWGGKVRIGSMGCNPMNHLVLRNVELIAPENDTVCMARKLAFRFDGFPYDKHGLSFSKVQLTDVFYHLDIDSTGINLNFIINYFASDEEKEETTEPVEFKVLVDDLILDNVCYRQDLLDLRTPEERELQFPMNNDNVGVDVKHMEYRDIRGRFRNVRVDLDRVTCRIDRLSTTERSGLQLKEFQGNVYATQSGISVTNMLVETADSRLMGDVLLDFRHWNSMGYFLDSVYFTVHFDEGSYGGMQDAAYWAHALWGMDEQISIEGDFAGPISDFRADNMKIAFGNESTIDLDAYIYGLPNIDTTIIGADIHQLHTTYEDLAAVRHPGKYTLKAEELLKMLNKIDLEASFTGTIYDFYATLGMQSDLGSLKGDVVMSMNPTKKEYRYAGELSSEGFSIGRLAPNEWLSRGGFDISFEGNGFDPRTMNASAEGQLHHLVIKGQRILGEMAVDFDATGGLLSLDASLDDILASLLIHGEGDWHDDYPRYRATVDAQNLDMKRFGLWYDDADSMASVSFHADARYSEPDDANNFIRLALSDMHLLTSTKNVRMKSLTLSSRMQNHWMNTTLRSDVADANLRGYYRYADLPILLRQIVNDYVPGYVSVDNTGKELELVDSRFEFNMDWKDTAGLVRCFVPKLEVAVGTTLQANYNVADGFKPILRSDSIGWGDLRFFDIGINGEAVADHYQLQMKSDRLMLGQLQLMDFGTLRLESSHEATSCRLYWQNGSQFETDGASYGGDVNLRLVADRNYDFAESGDTAMILRLIVDPSHLAIGGRDWSLFAEGDNYMSPQGIYVDKLGIVSGNQQLMLTGSLSNEGADSIQFILSQLGLEVANPFLASSGISLGGKADGRVIHTKTTTGAMRIDNMAFNGEPLGNLTISSLLDDSLGRLYLTVSSPRTDSKISLDGYLTLGDDDPKLLFDASLREVGLHAISPFVSNFSSHVEGDVSAMLSLRGTLSKPLANGFVAVEDGLLNVDFLNVPFSFSDTIDVVSTHVRLDNFIVSDPDGGEATVTGDIDLSNLDSIPINLTVNSQRLLCMNTTPRQSTQYYGRIVAAVDGRVRGYTSNLDIVLNASTLEGSSLAVPVDDRRQMEQADYIHFLTDDYDYDYIDITLQDSSGTTTLGMQQPSWSNESQWALTINVEVTQDLQFRLPLDFSSITADVKARGNGDLQLTLGSARSFGLAGDYEINNGTLLLDLLGVVSKEFNIDEGSSITLPGNIQGAMFDIRAVLSQRVNLSTLTGSLSSTDSQKPVQVENVIALSGTLSSPNVSFDIRLPGADQSVQEEVFSYIDRNNERDMLTQTLSLLISKRFSGASVSTDASGGTASDQAYGIVMSTLGSMLSDMVQVVDVNFDYQSGNGLTTDQYAVDISKEWNKFYFESTFGFGGESRELATSGNGNNNMTGDMLVGYKINPRLHLFVFNRTNTNDYTRSDLPYKQGVGLKYTRDFDRIRDLFIRKKKR